MERDALSAVLTAYRNQQAHLFDQGPCAGAWNGCSACLAEEAISQSRRLREDLEHAENEMTLLQEWKADVQRAFDRLVAANA